MEHTSLTLQRLRRTGSVFRPQHGTRAPVVPPNRSGSVRLEAKRVRYTGDGFKGGRKGEIMPLGLLAAPSPEVRWAPTPQNHPPLAHLHFRSQEV